MTHHAPATSAELVKDDRALAAVAARAADCAALAVDVEADGLFAYRPKLCVLQIGFVSSEEGSATEEIALIDTLAIQSIDVLRDVLGPDGPPKIMHDMTFDARLLAERGVVIGNIWDTSVAARFLDYPSTGLSALVKAELDVSLDKAFQHYNWAKRPLQPQHLSYLTNDVRYLSRLWAKLWSRAEEVDICPEVTEECAYKLHAALTEDKPELRPAFMRTKGFDRLDPPSRVTLKHLHAARERIAERRDVPPFKVVGNDLLFRLAAERPTTPSAVKKSIDNPRLGRYADPFLEAIQRGIADGTLTPEENAMLEHRKPPREVLARRRMLENRTRNWRKKHAKEMSISEQVVMPGHCVSDLVDVWMEHSPQNTTDEQMLASTSSIPGIGSRRVERYGAELVEIWRQPAAEPETTASTH